MAHHFDSANGWYGRTSGCIDAAGEIPLAAVLLVAIFAVHLPYGFSSIKLRVVTPGGAVFGPVGYEMNLLYLAALASLVLGGSGPFAIDGLLKNGTERSGP
jgi:putative oxidoreductase